jgi:maltose alpha-D-glucosyltransferase/alpha-amylase
MALGILENRVAVEANGWQYTMDNLSLFFERALAGPHAADMTPAIEPFPLTVRIEMPPPLVHELLGDYVGMVRLLGRRTAEMHIALASRPDDPAFAPEPFTDFYQRSLYHGMLGLSMRSFEMLRTSRARLPEDAQEEAGRLVKREEEVRGRLQALRDRRMNVTRIRHHGDFHLGQVLHTGKDFVIIDFEGDPSRSIGQRRIKRSPLRDVASMLRSLHYAAHSALFGQVPGLVAPKEGAGPVRVWAEFWSSWAYALFLTGYLETAGHPSFLPESPDDARVLLEAFLLERALTELRYELTQRLDWARIPVHGILEILGPVSDAPRDATGTDLRLREAR